MKKIRYPKVLLVGRTNVGKSTLFNRLINHKKSIVYDQDGVTRDYVEEIVTWDDKAFALIDTGGIMLRKNLGPIEAKVQEKVNMLLESGDVVLFVCDAKSGITQDDRLIARRLHKLGKPTILLLNKTDNNSRAEESAAEFSALGFRNIIHMSAIHGVGIGELLDQTVALLPSDLRHEVVHPHYRVAIIGKPNVGKSSLMNLLTRQERSIVSDVAGTTREAISETIYHCSDLVEVTDTAGIRKKSRVNEDLETLMVKNSLQSVREADVVLLMVDASAGAISDQELKLLFLVYESHKPVIVLFNKTDLMTDYNHTMLDQDLDSYDFILRKIPTINISCMTKKNVGKILNVIQQVLDRCKQKFNSTDVDDIVKQELTTKPLYHNRMPLKLFKIRAIPGQVPTFVLHVNQPDWFGKSELNCFENILRKHFDLSGCPIQFSVRKV